MGDDIYRKLSPFSPRLVSKQTVKDRNYQTLYEDAMRRVNSPTSDKKLNSSPSQQYVTAKRNNSYLRKRFMNDYDQLMYSRSKQPIKTFDGFVSVLKELGYIRQNSVPLSPRHNQEQSI